MPKLIASDVPMAQYDKKIYMQAYEVLTIFPLLAMLENTTAQPF